MADAPGEMDAVKVFVVGMAAVSAIGAGVVWWLHGEVETTEATVASARGALKEVAEGRYEVTQMLKAYRKNKEDEARDQPLTWFQSIWKSIGIPDNSIQPVAWKVPADIGPDGSYKEESISIKFSNKNPLTRAMVGQFLHRVEQSSSRLRVLSFSVRRSGRDETLAEDQWTGQCEIGYRYPFAKE